MLSLDETNQVLAVGRLYCTFYKIRQRKEEYEKPFHWHFTKLFEFHSFALPSESTAIIQLMQLSSLYTLSQSCKYEKKKRRKKKTSQTQGKRKQFNTNIVPFLKSNINIFFYSSLRSFCSLFPYTQYIEILNKQINK